MTQIAVIILHHTGDLIFKATDSVLESIGVDYNVYVITSDPILAEKGIKDCTVLHHTGTPCAKRNYASEVCDEPYLVFMDDDVEVEHTAIRELYNAVRKPTVGLVFGKLFNAEYRNRLDEAGGYLTWTGFIWSRAEQNIPDKFYLEEAIFAGKSALCIIRKSTFWNVGRFDEDFGILGEESDLAWRVWLSAECVTFCPRAIGYHYFNTKFKPIDKFYTMERIYYNGCRNYITMLLKNLGKENLWKIVPVHAAIWTFVGLAMLITGKRKQGWNILRGIIYVIKNWPNIMRKRRMVQKLRMVSDKELKPFIYRRTKFAYYRQRLTRYLTLGLHG